MKYTHHKLTGPMLKRLSQLANGHPHGHGTSLDALERRGLALERAQDDPKHGGYQHSHMITAEGLRALEQARREGW